MNFGSALMRARSAVGGCSIASTSPDSSAATRADSFLMILNVTLLPRRLLAPVVVVADEVDAVAGGVLDELVASAADRRLAAVEVLGRGAGRHLLRHDVDRRQVVGRERIRRRVLEADRVGIDDLLRDDRLRVRGERAGAVRHVRHAVDREHDVLGGQLAAVGELDALAQLEFPRLVVDRLPRRREPGDHLRVRVHLHELVEDVLGDVVVREQVEEMRIDRRDVGGDGDLEVRRRRPAATARRPRAAAAMDRARRSGEWRIE